LIVPCGHFECYDVIRNKDEWFVDVVGDRREPRWYRGKEVYTDDQNPDLNGCGNHGGVIAECSENHIYSLHLEIFYGKVHVPLLFVEQLENSVLGRAENNDKSARQSNFNRNGIS